RPFPGQDVPVGRHHVVEANVVDVDHIVTGLDICPATEALGPVKRIPDPRLAATGHGEATEHGVKRLRVLHSVTQMPTAMMAWVDTLFKGSRIDGCLLSQTMMAWSRIDFTNVSHSGVG